MTESLPQLLVQTVCYVIGREAGLIILTPIFLFSATLSAISICKASLYLAWRAMLCGSWRKVGHRHARGYIIRSSHNALSMHAMKTSMVCDCAVVQDSEWQRKASSLPAASAHFS